MCLIADVNAAKQNIKYLLLLQKDNLKIHNLTLLSSAVQEKSAVGLKINYVECYVYGRLNSSTPLILYLAK